MWRKIRWLSLPHLRGSRLRTLLTIVGVALGVAAMVGLRLAYAPISRSYARSIEKLSGQAALRVVNGSVGVPEELVEELRALPGVRKAVAVVRGQLLVDGSEGERLTVLGIDFLEDSTVREYRLEGAGASDDALRFLAQIDSVALVRAFLDERGLEVGDRLRVLGPDGPADLVVRGALTAEVGPASLFGGRLAVMDLYAAQALFRLDRRFSQIDLVIEPGAAVAVVEADVARVTAGRGSVERSAASLAALERMLQLELWNSTSEAFGAVLAGVYVILNTMLIGVLQRRREIAILRALGMRRAELVRLIVTEALVLGVIGCGLGVPLGLALAQTLSVPFLAQLGAAFVPIAPPDVTLEAEPVLVGVCLGIVAVALGALVPAFQAVRVSPLAALRPTEGRPESGKPYRIAACLGLGLTALAAATWALRGDTITPFVAALVAEHAFLVGAALVLPFVLRGSIAGAGRMLGRRLPGVGALVAENLGGHRGRIALTAAVLALCFAYVVHVGAAYASLEATMTRWFDATFADVDAVLSAGGMPLSGEEIPLPTSLESEVARLPGVAGVGALRRAMVDYRGGRPWLLALDVDPDGRRLGLVSGDPRAAAASVRAGTGVVVDEAFVYQFGVTSGDRLELATPSGPRGFPIVGVSLAGRSQDVGTVLIARSLYRDLWRDETITLVEVQLTGPEAFAPFAAAARQTFGSRHPLLATPLERFRGELEADVRKRLAEVPPILATAVLIALLALVNAVFAAVLDRRREIGITRALGATRGQIARAVSAEAAVLGLLAAVSGCGLGALLAFIKLDILGKAVTGASLVYTQPVGVLLAVPPLAALLAAVAGVPAARHAARLVVVRALDVER